MPDAERKHFTIDLLIAHPAMKPTTISLALGLSPAFSHQAGEAMTTAAGTYPDTRWRYRQSYETGAQWFAADLAAFVQRLKLRQEFLAQVRQTGGQLCVIVQFPGDGYFGDNIGIKTLALLAGLGLELGIECGAVPQSE